MKIIKVISIGKAKKFILLDDFKRLNMGIKDIDVRGVWKELGYFIEDEYKNGEFIEVVLMIRDKLILSVGFDAESSVWNVSVSVMGVEVWLACFFFC